jgi:LacI family transcriptional regulator
VATAPLTRVISGLTGVHDLDDPALAGLTRAARYDTLLGLAAANLRAGRPVVLVAPFSTERPRPLAIDGTMRHNQVMPSMAQPPAAQRSASGPTRLLDVANAAGVSLRTASRVLNDDPRVASVTRQRVRAAMLDLRFEPDAMARSLRAGTDTAVGFVVESISDPFFAEVIDAVELEMSRHGRSVLVTSTRRDPGWERDVIGRMLQRRVAGLLLCPTGDDHAWLDPHVPVVLVDRPAPGLSADLVEIDDHRAAFDAVAHLIAHGHRRIAYIGDTPAIPTSAARLRGYRDALARYGIEADEQLVNTACPASQDAADAVTALLAGSRPPTAILSATTRASLGVVPALHSAGRTDIGLVSFGDFPMADSLRPAVTVVDHPGHEVGRVAAARLLARLGQPDLPVERIQVPARLIERGSGEQHP